MHDIHQLFEKTELYYVKEHSGKVIFDGDHSRDILIICNCGLSQDEKNFISKILGSVKLNLSDVALMNSLNAPAYHQLKTAISFKKLILFGVTPAEIGLNIDYVNYAPVAFRNIQILASDSLARLEESEPSKNLLWKALKKMFL